MSAFWCGIVCVYLGACMHVVERVTRRRGDVCLIVGRRLHAIAWYVTGLAVHLIAFYIATWLIGKVHP